MYQPAPLRVSTIGTSFLSSHIESALGNLPSKLMITTQCNPSESVSFREESNRTNPPTNPSVISRFRNEMVASEGGDEGFENKAERRCDGFVVDVMMSLEGGKK